ncbi:MAG: porin [Rhodospirillales bacterium]|nr:porin [Rhodospirillales bacterium]MDH3912219.1 porin [Rhodospirillales bacterium]MDH3918862.1 porin [Rhodospirillales bacterium]MDH3966496.1 porin [Rhodospirillales bacterium]
MKKALYGTTALFAAGALMASPASAAEKIKLGVGGYYQSVFSFVDQDEPNNVRGWHKNNLRQEGEVHFTGSTTLDNGITFGVQIQLEAITQSDQIDEHFLYVEGSFGRANIGAENSAPYLMGYTAPTVALGVNSPNFFLFETLGGAGTATVIDVKTSDANKLTYFSPRFSGFQLGVSYTANTDVRGGDRQTAGLTPDNDELGNNVTATEEAVSDFISLGANYVQTFDNIDVAVSLGYVTGTWEDESGSENGTGLPLESLQEYGFGLNVGFSGFTVGGSFYHSNNFVDDGKLATNAYDVGVTYETGPWGVGLAYLHSETQAFSSWDSDEQDLVELGLSYAMGPGIKLVVSGQYFNEDNDSTADTDGVGFAVGSMLSF